MIGSWWLLPRRPRWRRRGQAGSALVEVTWLGLLMLVPLVYLVISVISVQRAAFGATEAARAAGRAYILAPDVTTARARAYAAARLAMTDQGVALDPGDLALVCRPRADSCLLPGSRVEVHIDLAVALPLAPHAFGSPIASVAVHAVHVEPYGIYREPGR